MTIQLDLLRPAPLAVIASNPDQFTEDFADWLPDNLHVYEAFEREALSVAGLGFKHYSARTIIHVLRHHSALTEQSGDGWKLNNNVSPYLARVFALLHPRHATLFEFREAKAAKRDACGVAA